ncbi:MAG: hypothetical protein KGJ62_07050 [Armatimonadetes bacterium]|nr:hypothetical protein [Armatimonadota bacterium]MDE2207309.1 hypothetical protein [Armatimonadota bacterium]
MPLHLPFLIAATMAATTPPTLPQSDLRLVQPPVTLNTPRTFPVVTTLAAWRRRRAAIRRQVLVSCGLYPLPRRTRLNAKVFDWTDHPGYRVAKVAIETYPHFYLAGNLYTPLGQPPHGKWPGILVAHGHWADGRLQNSDIGSIPARCITFARMGCVAFSYDMVGYNDTRQLDHSFGDDREHWLWGVTLIGLQTWNSIRCLDFLKALPEVDGNRLAITGESGGGSQTMLLTAVDDRLAAVAPCVMVSHTMQGGCLCENGPELRIRFSNMELAACAAPKPQIMVGATGDWTRTMMTVEGPAVRSIYQLYHHADRLATTIVDAPHNINRESRTAVDRFFGKWLLHRPKADSYIEPPYTMPPLAELRVFPNGMPADAAGPAEYTAARIAEARALLAADEPHDAASLKRFNQRWLPVWRDTLQARAPGPGELRTLGTAPTPMGADVQGQRLAIGRAGFGDRIECMLYSPARRNPALPVVALADSDWNPLNTAPTDVAKALLRRGAEVLIFHPLTAAAETARGYDPWNGYFTCYNRTLLQDRVQDCVTAMSWLRQRFHGARVAIAGTGWCGLPALLAAPDADAAMCDAGNLDLRTDAALLTNDLYSPLLRKMGDFTTAALLAAPHPLLVMRADSGFSPAAAIMRVYHNLGQARRAELTPDALSPDDLATWFTSHTGTE